MTVGAKLQLKAGHAVAILGAPADVEIDLPAGAHRTPSPDQADAVIVFVRTADELARRGGAAIGAARADRLSWIAYPKAGQLETDLNRDRLASLVVPARPATRQAGRDRRRLVGTAVPPRRPGLNPRPARRPWRSTPPSPQARYPLKIDGLPEPPAIPATRSAPHGAAPIAPPASGCCARRG